MAEFKSEILLDLKAQSLKFDQQKSEFLGAVTLNMQVLDSLVQEFNQNRAKTVVETA